MYKQVRQVAVVILISLLLSGFACNRTKVAAASRDIAASVKAFQVAEIALHNQGKLSDAEHKNIETYLKGIATAGLAVDSCVLQTSTVTCVDTGIAAANDLINQGLVGVKNPDVKQQLTLAAQLIVTGFNTLKGLL